MTGFARINGCLSVAEETFSWSWELKSVNGKNLDIKYRLPTGYDDVAISTKAIAAEIINRGNISALLEITNDTKTKKIKIDTNLLNEITNHAIDLCNRYYGKVALPSAAELLNLRGVVEIEENILDDETINTIKQKIIRDFATACQNLQIDRQKEGEKIKIVLQSILKKIEHITDEIEKTAENIPAKLREKLKSQIEQYKDDVNISEDRIAQEIVLLITRADIREEIDRLKTHIKSAYNLLSSNGSVGRRLDFLCQELNREANTTCSKSSDIIITNYGMELKALIEQFREQVQNIE